MNIAEFCRSLSATVDHFSDCLPSTSLQPFRSAIQRVEPSLSSLRTREEIIQALFALSATFDAASTSLQSPVVAESLNQVISRKVDELAASVFQAPPAKRAALDKEILETEAQLAKATQAIGALGSSGKSGDAAADVLLAMTGVIAQLTEKLRRLRESAESAAGCRAASCAGLRNRSNKCYAYGCLKGLWASKRFCQIVERAAVALEEHLKTAQEKEPRRRLTALYLHRLFTTFDATLSVEVIEPEEKAIADLLSEMAVHHPFVGKSEQQDATEFINCLLEDIFQADEALFSYIERKERPAGMLCDACIPSIDIPEQVRGNLFIVRLPSGEGAQISVQDSFEPMMTKELLEKEAIAASEHNKEKDVGCLFETLASLPASVDVRRHRLFQGTAPACLFIHLWRQIKEVDIPLAELKKTIDPSLAALGLSDEELKKVCGRTEGIKVPSRVAVQRRLSIHHVDGTTIHYRLLAAIIHAGQARKGHYFAYLAVPDGAAATTAAAAAAPSPSGFVCHNDHQVFRMADSEKLKRDLEENSYVLIYDREE